METGDRGQGRCGVGDGGGWLGLQQQCLYFVGISELIKENKSTPPGTEGGLIPSSPALVAGDCGVIHGGV